MTNKTWRLLAIGYVISCLAVTALEGNSWRHAPLSPLDKILATPLCWGFAVFGVQNGYVRGRFSRVEREESPFAFWLNIACYSGFGLFLLCSGVRDAVR